MVYIVVWTQEQPRRRRGVRQRQSDLYYIIIIPTIRVCVLYYIFYFILKERILFTKFPPVTPYLSKFLCLRSGVKVSRFLRTEIASTRVLTVSVTYSHMVTCTLVFINHACWKLIIIKVINIIIDLLTTSYKMLD